MSPVTSQLVQSSFVVERRAAMKILTDVSPLLLIFTFWRMCKRTDIKLNTPSWHSKPRARDKHYELLPIIKIGKKHPAGFYWSHSTPVEEFRRLCQEVSSDQLPVPGQVGAFEFFPTLSDEWVESFECGIYRQTRVVNADPWNRPVCSSRHWT